MEIDSYFNHTVIFSKFPLLEDRTAFKTCIDGHLQLRATIGHVGSVSTTFCDNTFQRGI